jgi:hypothetical protein
MNVRVDRLIFPVPLALPWEDAEIKEIDLTNPPKNSRVNFTRPGIVIIEEKDGNRVFLVPQSLIITAGILSSIATPGLVSEHDH